MGTALWECETKPTMRGKVCQGGGKGTTAGVEKKWAQGNGTGFVQGQRRKDERN